MLSVSFLLIPVIGILLGWHPAAGNPPEPGSSPAPEVILGVFGGTGPEATVNFFQLVVELTPATKDQEHIPTLIYSFPQVPDRPNRAGVPVVNATRVLAERAITYYRELVARQAGARK